MGLQRPLGRGFRGLLGGAAPEVNSVLRVGEVMQARTEHDLVHQELNLWFHPTDGISLLSPSAYLGDYLTLSQALCHERVRTTVGVRIPGSNNNRSE